MPDIAKLGRRGTLVIPSNLRRRFGLAEGELVLFEERDGALTIRPAIAMTLETYPPERRAAFLLNNAIGAADYRRACKAVRAMGLDPEAIDHQRPVK